MCHRAVSCNDGCIMNVSTRMPKQPSCASISPSASFYTQLAERAQCTLGVYNISTPPQR